MANSRKFDRHARILYITNYQHITIIASHFKICCKAFPFSLSCNARILCTDTCRYNVVQFTIWHTALRWQQHNVNQTSTHNRQRIPCSNGRALWGVSIVRILKKIDRLITARTVSQQIGSMFHSSLRSSKRVTRRFHSPWVTMTSSKTCIDGLIQERRNTSALAMDLRLFCTNSSTWHILVISHRLNSARAHDNDEHYNVLSRHISAMRLTDAYMRL